MAGFPVFVVGVPRSGTSWTTSEIARRGYWVGPYAKSADNPLGFFENAALRSQFVKPLLKDPSGLKHLPEQVIVNSRVTREAMEEVIRGQGHNGEPWVWKCCKMLFMWPSFARLFPEAVWVKVRRRDEQILDSFKRTGFMKRVPVEDHAGILKAYKDRLLEAPGMEVWPFEEEEWISRLPSA